MVQKNELNLSQLIIKSKYVVLKAFFLLLWTVILTDGHGQYIYTKLMLLHMAHFSNCHVHT